VARAEVGERVGGGGEEDREKEGKSEREKARP
jgi:hypothetical protein